MIPENLQTFLHQFGKRQQKALFLTGAGISVESGIPTFRGNDGYWTIGSKNYTPMEIATNYMFKQFPEKVWRWALHYFDTARSAQPNAGHEALVTIEKKLGSKRFTLVTQNVDGLHLLAGNSPTNTYCIHGTLSQVRCDDCGDIYPFPEDLGRYTKNDIMPDEEWDKLTCPDCNELMRPHVLFFDEYYSEAYYKYESALEAAFNTDLLVVIGTTGATNLPSLIFEAVLKTSKPIIVVNLEDSTFTHAVAKYRQGWVLKGKSGEILPTLAEFF